jgi:hypothetical protein
MARSRKKKKRATAHPASEADIRESGQPGGGTGRRDVLDVPSGVHPMSAGADASRNAEIRTQASWGQGERGAEGYNDAGGSELILRDGTLLGGLTAGPSGEPTIDIHQKSPKQSRDDAARDAKETRKPK